MKMQWYDVEKNTKKTIKSYEKNVIGFSFKENNNYLILFLETKLPWKWIFLNLRNS